MAENSPITPGDLGAITDGLLACDHLKELLATRTKMQTFLQWLLVDDASGDLGDDFKLAIRNQLLFDALKKGWFVRTNTSTGYLELVQYVPLSSLDPAGAVDGDTLVFNGTQWEYQSAPTVYLAPTTGGPNPPDASVGGISTVAHGLTATPSDFRVFIECTAVDCGYLVGDKVDALGLMFLNSAIPEVMNGTTIFANATQVGIVFRNGSAACTFQLCNKGTFIRGNIDVTKWAVKFYAAL